MVPVGEGYVLIAGVVPEDATAVIRHPAMRKPGPPARITHVEPLTIVVRMGRIEAWLTGIVRGWRQDLLQRRTRNHRGRRVEVRNDLADAHCRTGDPSCPVGSLGGVAMVRFPIGLPL